MSTPKRVFKIHGMDCAEEIHSGSPLVSATHSIEVVGVPSHHLCEVTLRPRDHPTAAERREDKTASPKAMTAPKGRGPEVRVSCWHAA